MTLKEKFNNLVPKKFGGIYEPILIDCEKIADNYAIEFAEWLRTDWTYDERWSKITDSKELLEMFKKEKEL